MAIRLKNIVSKADWAKIIILLIVSVSCWVWVWKEYQKPIIPAEWVRGVETEKTK